MRPVGVTPILKGRLHVRLANIGHKVEGKVVSAGQTLPIQSSSKVVVTEDGSGAFLGGSLNLAARQTGKSLTKIEVYSFLPLPMHDRLLDLHLLPLLWLTKVNSLFPVSLLKTAMRDIYFYFLDTKTAMSNAVYILEHTHTNTHTNNTISIPC